jgi:nucleoid-associated protein YgaU
MDCPVCHKAGLAEETALCPQCDSDLSCFILLDGMAAGQETLERQLAEKDAKIKRHRADKQKALALCGVLACLGLVLAGLFYAVRAKSQMELRQLQADNLSLQDSIRRLGAQLEDGAPPLQSAKTLRYVIQKGDNLAKITRIFYGGAACCDSLKLHNDLRDDGRIFAGDTLLIKL